jgi:hypothetical protein
MTATTALAINIPLMVLAFALMTGIPLWLVLKHPDRTPARAHAVPQHRRVSYRRITVPPGIPS